MAACQDVQLWFTDNLLVPVTRVITAARETCEEVGGWVEENVTRPVESWVSRTERVCRSWPWPLNWLCEAVVVLVKVVEWVVETVVKWVVTIVCQVVTFVIGFVVEMVLRVVTWAVTFVVCVFSDPLGALKSLYDLWNIVLDAVRDVFDFVGVLLDDIIGILDDIDRLLESVGKSLGWLGLLLGLLRGLVDLVRRLVVIVKDIVQGIADLLINILTLNLCGLLRGLADIGVGIGRAVLELAAPAIGAGIGAIAGGPAGALVGLIIGAVIKVGGSLVAGVRDSAEGQELETIATTAINSAFEKDPDRAARAIASLNPTSRSFGIVFTPDARRLFIPSRSTVVNLATLHGSGVIDLFALAGYVSNCSRVFNEVDSEVVYAGTDLRVSFSDITTFLASGPGSVSAFNVYPIKRSKFRDHLVLAQKEARSLGVQLQVKSIGEFPITNADQLPMLTTDVPPPNGQRGLMAGVFGRTTSSTDPLQIIPSVSHFHYVVDGSGRELFGRATWMRPLGSRADSTPELLESGVTYRNLGPDYVFRYVLIHEMGHYLGLDHFPGTRGLEEIMFSPATGAGVTGTTVAEFLALGGEPRFTLQDARDAWAWFTGGAAAALFP